MGTTDFQKPIFQICDIGYTSIWLARFFFLKLTYKSVNECRLWSGCKWHSQSSVHFRFMYVAQMGYFKILLHVFQNGNRALN